MSKFTFVVRKTNTLQEGHLNYGSSSRIKLNDVRFSPRRLSPGEMTAVTDEVCTRCTMHCKSDWFGHIEHKPFKGRVEKKKKKNTVGNGRGDSAYPRKMLQQVTPEVDVQLIIISFCVVPQRRCVKTSGTPAEQPAFIRQQKQSMQWVGKIALRGDVRAEEHR